MLRLRHITRALLTIGVCMAFTPAVFSVGPIVETRLFPVYTKTRVLEEVADQLGVEFFLEFTKRRQCEFLGLAWYSGPTRYPVRFEPGSSGSLATLTRPIGKHRAGPWQVLGLQTLRNTRASALHRCHPLWITTTEFYRG